MKTDIRKLILSGLLFSGVFLTPGCDMQQFLSEDNNIDIGILKGTINIGPLCPVETVPPDPACLPTAETFKAYPVGIWTAGGTQKITTINPELSGSYNIQLPAGYYLINLENTRSGIGGSNLPVTVIINSGRTKILDINIDTGIRGAASI